MLPYDYFDSHPALAGRHSLSTPDVHVSPIGVPSKWIEKYRGKFDDGYDKLRARILVRQKELGIVPTDTKLSPWPETLPTWDQLTDTDKKVGARWMEVFCGAVEHTDYQIGRIVEAIEQTGELDNTLIIYIAGDNGPSPEGGLHGRASSLELLVLQSLVGRQLEMASSAVVRVILISILVPLAAGMAVRSFMPGLAVRIEKPIALIAKVLLPLALIVLLVVAAPAVLALIGNGGILIAMVVFLATGLTVGHVLGRPNLNHSVVLALSTACRHPAIALLIAAANFPEERFGATILLYVLVGAIVAVPYLSWVGQRYREKIEIRSADSGTPCLPHGAAPVVCAICKHFGLVRSGGSCYRTTGMISTHTSTEECAAGSDLHGRSHGSCSDREPQSPNFSARKENCLVPSLMVRFGPSSDRDRCARPSACTCAQERNALVGCTHARIAESSNRLPRCGTFFSCASL